MKRLSKDEVSLLIQVPYRLIHVIMHGKNPDPDGNLNKTHARTLAMLRHHGPLSMHGLSDLVGMPKGSFTQVVDKLVRMGLAERTRKPEDRRVVLVSITDRGRNKINEFDAFFGECVRETFTVLKEEEIDALLKALRTIEKTTRLIEERKDAG